MVPSSPHASTRPSRAEVVLSGVLWPGAGQLMQRRYLVGGLFISAALILVGFLLTASLYPLFVNLAIMLEMFGHTMNDELIESSIPRILLAAGMLIVLYTASLVDAAIAYRRRLRCWQREQRKMTVS